MQDDKIRQIIEENLKPQHEINSFVAAILAALIPAILAQAGKVTFEIALLIDIPILVIYLGWVFSYRKKSIINWNLFYRMLVSEKVQIEYTHSIVKGPAYDKLISDEVYNNYITFLYLSALYEGKDKFSQELWAKARIPDKPIEVEDEQKDKEKRMIQARYMKS